MTAMTTTPRAFACWTWETMFTQHASFGATQRSGMCSSIHAMGPCFISPAGYPLTGLREGRLALHGVRCDVRIKEGRSGADRSQDRICHLSIQGNEATTNQLRYERHEDPVRIGNLNPQRAAFAILPIGDVHVYCHVGIESQLDG